jgi:large subunit ribosomal protein L29
MKAKDLRDRTSEDLVELRNSLRKDLFSYRMKNHISQLDDTSLINKARKDLSRIELILHERTLASVPVAEAEGTGATTDGGHAE